MLIDTHCHLNFKVFRGREEVMINRAQAVGVKLFIVPGADPKTSQQAVMLAQKYPSVYAAVGVHPHHAVQHPGGVSELLDNLKTLILKPKVVAVGEIGIDLYQYEQTKYLDYKITPEFVKAQEQLFVTQIKLALEFNKTLILHNRQAVEVLLPLLENNWDQKLKNRTVFHCCEADERLLDFAIKHHIYIGVDGDLSWSKKKQRFIKQVPLEKLVLETDSPYLTPLSARKEGEPNLNEPKNVILICDLLAAFKEINSNNVATQTTNNAVSLFGLPG